MNLCQHERTKSSVIITCLDCGHVEPTECTHSKWDAHKDCVPCLLNAIESLNRQLTEARIMVTQSGSEGGE